MVKELISKEFYLCDKWKFSGHYMVAKQENMLHLIGLNFKYRTYYNYNELKLLQ